jgi:hypothetical protein
MNARLNACEQVNPVSSRKRLFALRNDLSCSEAARLPGQTAQAESR